MGIDWNHDKRDVSYWVGVLLNLAERPHDPTREEWRNPDLAKMYSLLLKEAGELKQDSSMWVSVQQTAYARWQEKNKNKIGPGENSKPSKREANKLHKMLTRNNP